MQWIWTANAVVAGMGILAARLHHLLVRPELSEMEALRHYWPLWLYGFVSMMVVVKKAMEL